MILEGKLIFYSETGTEGGYWAFQDNHYMSLSLPVFGVTNDTRVWDADDRIRSGLASNAELFLNEKWIPIPDPIMSNPDFEISSLFRGEQRGDLSADERLMNQYGFKIKYSGHAGSTPRSEPSRPYGIPQHGMTRVTVKWENGEVECHRKSDSLLIEKWDCKGLHVLKNGDGLEIIHPFEKSVVWKGIIELKPCNLFTEHAQGMWIHADQKGMSRDEWSDYFFKNFPAQLVV